MSHDMVMIWYKTWCKVWSCRGFLTDIRDGYSGFQGESRGGKPLVHNSSDDERVTEIVTTVSGVVVTKRRKKGCIIGYT